MGLASICPINFRLLKFSDFFVKKKSLLIENRRMIDKILLELVRYGLSRKDHCSTHQMSFKMYSARRVFIKPNPLFEPGKQERFH